MKQLSALVLMSLTLLQTAVAAPLPQEEAKVLKAEITQIMTSFDKGDVQAFFDKTHESAYVLAGGSKESFERVTKQAVEQVLKMGIKFLSFELGEPTELYSAGKYEVCFVPRISIMEYQGQKIKSTGFMIAARTTGHRTWKYLDGAGLRRNPGLLNILFPDLDPSTKLPPNTKELL